MITYKVQQHDPSNFSLEDSDWFTLQEFTSNSLGLARRYLAELDSNYRYKILKVTTTEEVVSSNYNYFEVIENIFVGFFPEKKLYKSHGIGIFQTKERAEKWLEKNKFTNYANIFYEYEIKER